LKWRGFQRVHDSEQAKEPNLIYFGVFIAENIITSCVTPHRFFFTSEPGTFHVSTMLYLPLIVADGTSALSVFGGSSLTE